jgi:hypothetical protein
MNKMLTHTIEKKPQFLNFRRQVCLLAHFTELEMLPL